MPSFPFPVSTFVPLPVVLLLFLSCPFSANCLFSGLLARKFSNSFCQGVGFCAWLLFVVGGNYHKYRFCRYKSFVTTSTCLQQTRVCHDKTHLLLQQKYVCHDKTFVATKMILVAVPTNDACWACCRMALQFAIMHLWTIFKSDCFCPLLF